MNESLIIKSVSIMSKESIKLINKVYKGIIISVSLTLGVVAVFTNPGHLFTAGLIFAFGINSEIISKDAADIC